MARQSAITQEVLRFTEQTGFPLPGVAHDRTIASVGYPEVVPAPAYVYLGGGVLYTPVVFRRQGGDDLQEVGLPILFMPTIDSHLVGELQDDIQKTPIIGEAEMPGAGTIGSLDHAIDVEAGVLATRAPETDKAVETEVCREDMAFTRREDRGVDVRACLTDGVCTDPDEREALATLGKPTLCSEFERGKGAAAIVCDTQYAPVGSDAQMAGGLSATRLLFQGVVGLQEPPIFTIERECGHHPFPIITIGY